MTDVRSVLHVPCVCVSSRPDCTKLILTTTARTCEKFFDAALGQAQSKPKQHTHTHAHKKASGRITKTPPTTLPVSRVFTSEAAPGSPRFVHRSRVWFVVVIIAGCSLLVLGVVAVAVIIVITTVAVAFALVVVLAILVDRGAAFGCIHLSVFSDPLPRRRPPQLLPSPPSAMNCIPLVFHVGALLAVTIFV